MYACHCLNTCGLRYEVAPSLCCSDFLKRTSRIWIYILSYLNCDTKISVNLRINMDRKSRGISYTAPFLANYVWVKCKLVKMRDSSCRIFLVMNSIKICSTFPESNDPWGEDSCSPCSLASYAHNFLYWMGSFILTLPPWIYGNFLNVVPAHPQFFANLRALYTFWNKKFWFHPTASKKHKTNKFWPHDFNLKSSFYFKIGESDDHFEIKLKYPAINLLNYIFWVSIR